MKSFISSSLFLLSLFGMITELIYITSSNYDLGIVISSMIVFILGFIYAIRIQMEI